MTAEPFRRAGDPLGRVIAALETAGCSPRRHGAGWRARCPAHDDHHASLDLDRGDDCRVLLICRAGCTQQAVIASLPGITAADLFADEPRSAGRRILATYAYHDADRTLLYEVVRFEPKGFAQRRPDGRGGWLWDLKGVLRVLYQMPVVIAAVREGRLVWIVEGEKDVTSLSNLGLVATCNPGGAGKWRSEYARVLAGAEVVILPDNDDIGRGHAAAVAATLAGVAATVKIVPLPNLPLKGDVSDWVLLRQRERKINAEIVAELVALAKAVEPEPSRSTTGSTSEARPASDGHSGRRSVWATAQPLPDFLATEEADGDRLDDLGILVRAAITQTYSPRGVGKTHVAHALAVSLSRSGLKVLLIDRDNSRREVKRRLRAWSGGDPPPTLKVLTRESAPPLTDAAAWAAFPVIDYDLVIIDSIDATMEGVGEGDSAKPSKAIAPLLDIVRRDDGPAAWVLGNTIRSGLHSRGSGVIEDRGDIVFECRDATGFQPTGTKPWVEELPPADAGSWAARSTRRKRSDVYRLAFICSKYRVGEEPEPFVLEIDLRQEPWTLRDVTDDVDRAGAAARQAREAERAAKFEAAVAALVAEVGRRAAASKPMKSTEARAFLRAQGLTSHAAQEVVTARDGAAWILREMPGRGRPVALYPAPGRCGSEAPADEKTDRESSIETGTCDPLNSSGDVQQERTKSTPPKSPENQAVPNGKISSAGPFEPDAPASEGTIFDPFGGEV